MKVSDCLHFGSDSSPVQHAGPATFGRTDAVTLLRFILRMVKHVAIDLPLADATNGLFDLVFDVLKPLIKRYSRRRS